MNDNTHTIPNPGSKEAEDRGCTCPVMDNHYGEGIRIGEEVVFWRTQGCPLHDPEKENVQSNS